MRATEPKTEQKKESRHIGIADGIRNLSARLTRNYETADQKSVTRRQRAARKAAKLVLGLPQRPPVRGASKEAARLSPAVFLLDAAKIIEYRARELDPSSEKTTDNETFLLSYEDRGGDHGLAMGMADGDKLLIGLYRRGKDGSTFDRGYLITPEGAERLVIPAAAAADGDPIDETTLMAFDQLRVMSTEMASQPVHKTEAALLEEEMLQFTFGEVALSVN